MFLKISQDLPANGVYFLAYECIQEYAKKQTGSDKVSLAVTLFAGGSAGIAYWLVGMPADVLKSRLQTGKFGLVSSKLSYEKYCLMNFQLPRALISTEFVAYSKN